MLIYAEKITPRLLYITDFIGKEITGEPFHLTTDGFYFHDYTGPKINYSKTKINDEELIIKNSDLLFEDSIGEQAISFHELEACLPDRQGFKAFFKTDGDYPFDIFAAAFYLLSRYEEYLPHQKDKYGRYAHENSLAYKENFLDTPLINIWIEDFKKVLKYKFPSLILPAAQAGIHHSPFTFQPTYDIDEAFAFRLKGILRTAGGGLKSIAGGSLSDVKERMDVLSGEKTDPYDSYSWLDELHERYKLKPLYFFLVPVKRGKYDKNISPSHPDMEQLIKRHTEKYSVGIHPSWRSGDEEELLENEIWLLQNLCGKKITCSRQHYIRFTLPETFRRLISAGITDDYSMGYGSINGFRASVASSFYWYDLKKEQQTNLLLHPYCFMEATSIFQLNHTPQQAAEELQHYYQAIKSVNGTLITIWHNTSLGTYPKFAGWKEMYEEFVQTVYDEEL